MGGGRGGLDNVQRVATICPTDPFLVLFVCIVVSDYVMKSRIRVKNVLLIDFSLQMTFFYGAPSGHPLILFLIGKVIIFCSCFGMKTMA